MFTTDVVTSSLVAVDTHSTVGILLDAVGGSVFLTISLVVDTVWVASTLVISNLSRLTMGGLTGEMKATCRPSSTASPSSTTDGTTFILLVLTDLLRRGSLFVL